MWEQVVTGAAAAAALVALALAALALRRAHRAESLVAELLTPVAAPTPTPVPVADAAQPPVADDDLSTYVITGVPVARPIDGRLFVDIVARESVVKAASWTHGLRRALSPENRNRIRFEVRQETRRAARERRAETKRALRELRARERAVMTDRVGEDVA
jgi:hypothetical protein